MYYFDYNKKELNKMLKSYWNLNKELMIFVFFVLNYFINQGLVELLQFIICCGVLEKIIDV